MATYFYNDSVASTADNHATIALQGADGVIFGSAAVYSSTGANAPIVSLATDNKVTVDGHLYALGAAIADRLAVNQFGVQYLHIGTSGLVESLADDAIHLTTRDDVIINDGEIIGFTGIQSEAIDASITNNGHISGRDSGITLGGTGGGGDNVVNTGVISAAFAHGFGIYEGNSGPNHLVNSGTITAAAGTAIGFFGYPASQDFLVNSGTLIGGVDAILGSDGVQTIVNSGQISGDIMLGAGDDSFDGRAGIVSGLISGGAGDDVLIGSDRANDLFDGGTGADLIDGGGGNDIVSYQSAALGLTVDLLAPSKNTHDAAGDVLTSIETIRGSSHNDGLYGDNTANLLQGGAGNDTLVGRGGNDWLAGGLGDDMLVPGAGRDIVSGGDGNDTVSFRDVTAGVTISLTVTAAQPSYGNSYTLSGIENVVGTNRPDMLSGNDGANILSGMGFSDSLYGAGGADTLTGGTAVDIFQYKAVTDSTLAAPDLITDFTTMQANHLQRDYLDLSAIDADPATAGNQAFSFIGTQAFDGHAGEVRVDYGAATATVFADVDGDGTADMAIQLAHVTAAAPLAAADFML